MTANNLIEWVRLIEEAKKLGISIEEVKAFLESAAAKKSEVDENDRAN